MRVAVISISTSRATAPESAGPDLGGDALEQFARETLDATIAGRDLIPDDHELIAARLRHWADDEGAALILTTGGTGFSPTDVTPEATASVIERPAPGIPEAMRAASQPYTKHWMLSRATAGIRGTTLIVNFPGSPKSIAEAGGAIAAALPHAVALITGESGPGAANHVSGSSTTASH